MGLLPYEFKSYNVIKVEFPWLEKTVDSVISYLKTKDKFFLGTFEEAKIKQKKFFDIYNDNYLFLSYEISYGLRLDTITQEISITKHFKCYFLAENKIKKCKISNFELEERIKWEEADLVKLPSLYIEIENEKANNEVMIDLLDRK